MFQRAYSIGILREYIVLDNIESRLSWLSKPQTR
jgi:hypothetical protein